MEFSLFGGSPRKDGLNAIEMLKADHARVEDLFAAFKKLEDGDSPEIVDIVTMACLELMVHSKLEKEVFYPALQRLNDAELSKQLAEAEVEHESIDLLVEKLLTQSLDDEQYKANFTVVREFVEHHVKEEEEEMFPRVEALKIDLDALAKKMRARQMELVEEIESDPDIATASTGGQTNDERVSQAAYGRFEGPV